MRTLLNALAILLVTQVTAFAQQSFARVDIRCLRPDSSLIFRTADTNVSIGYGAWRPQNPRSIIAAQMPVSTNWTPIVFQFLVAKNDSVKLILRGRYSESEDLEKEPPQWVWVDHISVIDTNGVEIVRNGSFEKLHHDGRPERWGYKGASMPNFKHGHDVPAQDGERCLRVSFDGAAFYDFRARSNTWYTVRAFFRSE